MSRALQSLCALVLGCGVSAASAEIISYTSSTNVAPAYNRALEDLSALSAIGTAVRHDTYAFQVGTSGDYTFTSTAKFDNFLFLYSPTLNTVTPLTNAVKGNDDLLGLTTAGFSHSLTAGVNYQLITTGFGNTNFGAYSNTIGGPGTITRTSQEPTPALTADIFTYTGGTTGASTYTRALEDFSALSAVGINVSYNDFSFQVATSGTYTFISTAEFDNFLFLYSPQFDPTKPLAFGQAADDDLLGLTTAGFDLTLVAGIDYRLITTGFGPGNFGAFSTTIGGPGAILAGGNGGPGGSVPEPSGLALLVAAFGTMWLARRRAARLLPSRASR